MKKQTELILTQTDLKQLSALTNAVRAEAADLLDGELARASIVADAELPKDVVCMDSKVTFHDGETGKESVVTLVYPHRANIEDNRISILTPVGSALIGLRVGQVIEWPFPNGKERQLRVISVQHQS